MIKRLGKSKKGKKGAILVIVVLILALAMIFIASAMMLTQATRRRLYSTSTSSQARLTVTAASEVFLEALNMQEITDVQLDAMIGKTSGTDKIKMIVDNMPGMSRADDNCTLLDIYKDATDESYIYCDFTTIIGDSVENVQVVLHAEESDPSYGSQFKNQVEVAADVGCAQLRFTEGCGMWDKNMISRPTDNNIVLRGGYTGKTSGSQYFSDVVFGQDADEVWMGGGENFYGRLIFLQGSQLNGRSSAHTYGDVYLIGSDNSAGLALKDNSQEGLWGGFRDQNFIFAGRSVQKDTNDGNRKIKECFTTTDWGNKAYFLDKDGNSLGSSHSNMKGQAKPEEGYYYTLTNAATSASEDTLKAFKSTVGTYKSYDYSGSLPTAATVFKTLCPDGKKAKGDGVKTLPYDTYSPSGTYYKKGSVIPDGAQYILNPVTTSYPEYKDGVELEKNELVIDKITESKKLDPGYYYITASTDISTTTEVGNDTQGENPIVLAIDGSNGGEYRFYFEANRKLVLRGIIFAVYNADEAKPVLFIMENGAKVQFSHANDACGDGDLEAGKKLLCSAGFLSVPNREHFKTDTEAISYVTSYSWKDESKAVSNSAYKDHSGNVPSVTYSKYYNNKVRPTVFIYGVGNNIINVGGSVTIEAYIGLYGGGAMGPINTGGDHQQIYGRIECDSMRTFSNSTPFADDAQQQPVGEFAMPYCPQPLTNSTKPKQRIAKSKYKVVDVIYFYGSGKHTSATTTTT